MLVYVPDFITLLRQRYSTLKLPGGIHYDNSAVLCRMQYEVRLEKKVGSKTIVVELVARYGKVEFRRPFAEDFLTTGDQSKVMDTYEVERAACDKAKIPHVKPWVPANDTEKAYERYLRPVTCPCCGGELKCQVNNEGKELVAWVCSNEECRTQIGGKLANFVSRECMNIMGIGESIVEQLLEAGKLRFFTDFYTLTIQDIMDACSAGDYECNGITPYSSSWTTCTGKPSPRPCSRQ